MIKNYIIYAVLLSLLSTVAYSQVDERVRLYIRTQDSDLVFDKMVFGINGMATDGVDEELGENYDLPGPPPGEIHGFFRITDPVTEEVTSSYLNLMALPEHREDAKTYYFNVYNIVKTFTISWNKLPSEIDSAYITDTDTGEWLIIDMLDSNSAVVPNPAFSRLKINVWYSRAVGVEDNMPTESALSIAPNPATEFITVPSEYKNYEYRITNNLGSVVCIGNMTGSNTINVGNLAGGSYTLILSSGSNVITEKFIKL